MHGNIELQIVKCWAFVIYRIIKFTDTWCWTRLPSTPSPPRRMQLTLHATRRTPHGASRLVQAMSAWSVKPQHAPSRHYSTEGNEVPPLGKYLIGLIFIHQYRIESDYRLISICFTMACVICTGCVFLSQEGVKKGMNEVPPLAKDLIGLIFCLSVPYRIWLSFDIDILHYRMRNMCLVRFFHHRRGSRREWGSTITSWRRSRSTRGATAATRPGYRASRVS